MKQQILDYDTSKYQFKEWRVTKSDRFWSGASEEDEVNNKQQGGGWM